MTELNIKKIIGTSLLISGTTIGGGMLALPIAAGMAGFYPSLLLMLICCIFMALTGLLLLEALLWYGKGAHFITLTESLLGKKAKVVCWVVYLFLGYASLVAYIADGGVHFSMFSFGIEDLFWKKVWGCSLFSILMGGVLFLGRLFIEKANMFLFILMVISYLCVTGVGVSHIEMSYLDYAAPSCAWIGVPLFITTFSYQSMLPSLLPYFKERPQDLKFSILAGCIFTFFIYAFWLLIIMGTIPLEGEFGLKALYLKGVDATEHYQQVVHVSWVGKLSRAFSFFAISTSFIGIGMGLVDFLIDGFKLNNKKNLRPYFVILAVLPAWILSFSCPRIFYLALDWSGGFGDSVLNGIIPALLVWSGWYIHKKQPNLGLPLGKKTLVLVLICSTLIFVLGVFEQFVSVY